MKDSTICKLGDYAGVIKWVTGAVLLPRASTVDPGGAVPPNAPNQPQTVRLYTAQVTRDLPPEPAASGGCVRVVNRKKEELERRG